MLKNYSEPLKLLKHYEHNKCWLLMTTYIYGKIMYVSYYDHPIHVTNKILKS